MSGSVVFYRFKAQKEASTVQFEGTGISVWDLKKEILAENKLGKGADFDFAIYNADTNEEYSEDKTIVPRSTSVIARRLPPSRPGRGNAQYYMVSNSALPSAISGSMPTSAAVSVGRRGHLSRRFDGREDSPIKTAVVQAPQPFIQPSSVGTDEASKLAAFFGNTSEQWRNTKEKMSTATPIHFGAGRGRGAGGPRPPQASAAPDKPVPSGYVCYRCGQPGHWIQDCPTNDKPEWDNKPRIKRTTGIPKSFLQTVEAPAKDGEVNHQAGVMIGADGGFVIARPDAASWEKHRAVQANLTQNDIQNLPPTDPDLTCPLCNRLLGEAVKTPCCSTSYCEECIQNYLSENDFVCPECESKIKSLKNLVKDEDRRTRAKQYLEDMLKASKAQTEKEEIDANGDNANSEDENFKTEDASAAEEGELAGDEHQYNVGRAGRSTSPRNFQGTSTGPNGQLSNYNDTLYGQNGNGQGTGTMMMSGAGLSMNTMNNGGYQKMFNGMVSVPPQLQVLQNQIQQTMNILQSQSLPPQMRMQLAAQLQGLQFQYGQMMQMMRMNGAFGGTGMLMQQQMAMQMHQMQQMQQMQQMVMMQQQQQNRSVAATYNGGNNNGYQQGYGHQAGYSNGNMTRPKTYHQTKPNLISNATATAMASSENTPSIAAAVVPSDSSSTSSSAPSNLISSIGAEVSRTGAQFEEDSSDSPYMRIPANPKFRVGGVKRERPEDFVELGSQPIKRV